MLGWFVGIHAGTQRKKLAVLDSHPPTVDMPTLNLATAGAVTPASVRKLRHLLASDKTTVMVLVHAEWCGHCRVLLPQWKAAAAGDHGVAWVAIEDGAMDALKSRKDARDIARRLGLEDVSAFPTVIRSCDGARNVTMGSPERTRAGLVAFAHSACASSD
jgi:thiol-disulfide isomerase/thioredoxin